MSSPRNGISLQRPPQPLQKILIVGDEKVGKTSLVDRFTIRDFDCRYVPTLDVAIRKSPFAQYNLQLCDFSGKSQSTHLFRGAMGAVVVFDVFSFDGVAEWVMEIEHTCGPIPITIVGTKRDKHSPDPSIEERYLTLRINHQNVIGLYIVSSKDDYIIDLPFIALLENAKFILS